jgi:two-component system, LytTR family, sensor histidine kinase AlgZ
MSSIRQNPIHPLPDWRNAGVLMRSLLGVNLLAFVAVLVQEARPAFWAPQFVDLAAWVEPCLFVDLCLLALARDLLWRQPPRRAQVLVISGAMATVLGFHAVWFAAGLLDDLPSPAAGSLRAMLLAATAAAALLAYFNLRTHRLSPALAEARLQALNARIRPHFLFNSLNAVLSLIREDPRRAEQALEELADLFRALLKNPRDLVPLSEEIALSRQYLDLEKLRLGEERLRVEWEVGSVPRDTVVPPLLLQPLLENAVYHGIEPAAGGGIMRVACTQEGERLRIEIANPTAAGLSHAEGSRMALANIRERLTLYYDLEASLEIEESPERYIVRITLPCRVSPLPSAS